MFFSAPKSAAPRKGMKTFFSLVARHKHITYIVVGKEKSLVLPTGTPPPRLGKDEKIAPTTRQKGTNSFPREKELRRKVQKSP